MVLQISFIQVFCFIFLEVQSSRFLASNQTCCFEVLCRLLNRSTTQFEPRVKFAEVRKFLVGKWMATGQEGFVSFHSQKRVSRSFEMADVGSLLHVLGPDYMSRAGQVSRAGVSLPGSRHVC